MEAISRPFRIFSRSVTTLPATVVRDFRYFHDILNGDKFGVLFNRYDNEFGGLEVSNLTLRQFVEDVVENASATEDAEDRLYVLGHGLASLGNKYSSHPFFEDSRFKWNDTERKASALPFVGPAGSGVSSQKHFFTARGSPDFLRGSHSLR